METKRWMQTGLIGLAVVIALAEFTTADFWVSDQFYNATTGQWLVEHHGPAKAIFYKAPLLLLKIFGVLILIWFLTPSHWMKNSMRVSKRKLAVIWLSLVIIPSIVGTLKKATGIYCPWQTARYGRGWPDVGLFERTPEGCCGGKRGRCWPAGHASGGFALMSLSVLGSNPRQRRAGLAIGLLAGGIMGTYQMANGNHYLSHTLVTMFLAASVIGALTRMLIPNAPSAKLPSTSVPAHG